MRNNFYNFWLRASWERVAGLATYNDFMPTFFIHFSAGLAEHVLSLLDAKSLCACACVSKSWRNAIAHGMLWRKLIERKVRNDSLWRGLSERRGWYYLLLPAIIIIII